MFQDEKPIETVEEDKLGRANFSVSLAKSIAEWDGKGSLVLALNGKWGSGKSSVINLVKAELSKFRSNNSPTVIEFNPWFFSGEEKLNEHFFNEISKELAVKNSTKNDIKIAARLRLYAELLNLVPNQSHLSRLFRDILVVIAILGISVQQLLRKFNLHFWHSNVVLFTISIGLLGLSLVNGLLKKVAHVFDKRSAVNAKTVISFKEEIKQSLEKRKNKILIVIDDIDRLTPDEIRTLFKLIKINSDFPNVIYLLSFDRDIIKDALETQKGIQGQDYLEKIVQVTFDIPLVKQDRISKILIDECNKILERLPKSSELLLDENYWNIIYSSGLKNLFRNIRDVKRFASSLEFNLAFLHKGESMEANPVDFIAIEALRVFVPEFYNFVRVNKVLFTSSKENSSEVISTRRKEIEDELSKINEHVRQSVLGLISKLFPQIGKLLAINQNPLFFGVHYSAEEASKSLKICSPNFFDAYFTLVPGGDESELSQFEIDVFLSALNNKVLLEAEIWTLLKRSKLSQLLERIEHYTSDFKKIPGTIVSNILQVYFDISDKLPDNRSGFWGFSLSVQFERVIIRLIERDKNVKNNLNIIKEAITQSKGLFGPTHFVNIFTSKDDKIDFSPLVPENTIQDIQKAILKKIRVAAQDQTLILNNDFAFILFRWKEWSDNNDWEIYFKENIKTDIGLVMAIKQFISVMNVTSTTGTTRYNYFAHESLDHFISSDEVKVRLEKIRNEQSEIYLKNKSLIDMFIDQFRIDPRRI
jgi:predicted KAP-like P-loop ATPase